MWVEETVDIKWLSLFPRINLFKSGPYKPSEWQEEVSDFFNRNDIGKEGAERLKS